MANESEEPLISIIMPAYNAERFIGNAINSVLAQSYKNWELLITNDASTDKTCEFIERYRDSRIKIFHEKVNTGSAYLPRKLSFEQSTGKYVVNLDADDYIEPDYLRKLYGRLRECEADICCGKMVWVAEDGKLLDDDITIPRKEFDFSIQMTGKEAFFNTVPRWNIGMNGCMAKREVWEFGFNRTYKHGKRGIHDDENVSRYLLLVSKKVVFSDACHFYTVNSNSVTHVFNERIFDFMDADFDLLALIAEDYGVDSREYKAVEVHNYYAFRGSFGQFIRSSSRIDDKTIPRYLKRFKKWHDRINWKEVNRYEDIIHYLMDRNYYLEIILYLIYFKQFKTLKKFLLGVAQSIILRGTNNKYYKWYIYRKQREKLIRKRIYGKYNTNRSESGKRFPKYVVNVIDGTVQAGGLADRLRGILSTYAICKMHGLQYRLHFAYPFELEQFLEPNRYDWRVNETEICRNIKECDIVILDATEDSKFQFKKAGLYLESHLRNPKRQIQVFTNAGYAYTQDYSDLFHELFKPSEQLLNAINKQKAEIGNDYISVSARFLDLLGDFNETYGHGKALDENAACQLIEDGLREIEKIHDNHPGRKILVNSDSKRFLNAADAFEYTYVIPGNITHIDNKHADGSYERYEKTFLDFFMIAGASEIVLIKGRGMHRSGYPYAASLIFNKPFFEVNFGE